MHTCGRFFSAHKNKDSASPVQNTQSLDNKEINYNCISHLDTHLDISLQKYSENEAVQHNKNLPPNDPELQQVIAAWPGLPEHIKTAIKALFAFR